ncbi:DUF4897 domain-containing protein [Natrarchaeobaculum sulfurireducens]|uniref:DUF4897 domain-containing protein n=1 Tax=Natrarchaeobaculum sulfurireducens TaxID=2044521 RepID=UPI000E3CBF3D|nr:DUF4897 domain-containing protein [Natrarchaeobaculum sulfurireducens]
MEARGRRALICVLVVVGCLITLGPGASAAVAGDESVLNTQPQQQLNESDQSEEQLNESDQFDDADDVHIEVILQENGSATFTVDYRFENTSSEDWETLRDDVEENPDSYAVAELSDWNEILEKGENETDREMELSDASVATDTSSTPRDMGHVQVSFTWSAFAHVELNRMEVGGALAGFTLVDDTTLQLFWPDEYVVRDVEPTPENPPDESVLWDGDGTEFSDGQPWLVLIENGESAADETGDDVGPETPWLAVAGALGLLGIGAAVGWWLKRDNEPTGPASETPGGSSPTQATAPEGTQRPPPELLSNEERVLELLERRGGRIKQQEVVSELQWTEAKTSQVVGNLREADEIDVFRIGRENVLALPEEE